MTGKSPQAAAALLQKADQTSLAQASTVGLRAMIKYITIDLSIASKVERPMNRSDGTWTTARISDGAKATNRNRRNVPPIYSTHPSACVVAGPKMLLAYPHGNHIWAWIQPQPAVLSTLARAARRKLSAKAGSPTFLARTTPPTHWATSASARSRNATVSA